MKNDTKYYYRELGRKKWKELPLNYTLWFYQLSGTIDNIFSKYGLGYPVSVWVDDYDSFRNIYVVRDEIKGIKEMERWIENRLCVLEELKAAADCNSNDFITYRFTLV